MSDLCPRLPGHTLKRKRQDTDFDIAIDSDTQIDRLKRQNIDNDHNAIDLTPSHQIPEMIGSAAIESTQTTSTEMYQSTQLPAPLLGQSSPAKPKPSSIQSNQTVKAQQHRPTISSKQSTSAPKPQFSQQCALTSEPQSINDQSKGVQTWKPNEWDDDEFDSDEESMSLAVTMKLANELSLLKSFLDLYKKFNIHLGDIVSGPRHRGFLFLISSTVTRLDSHTTHLRNLRNEKQRGNPYPGNMELVAEKISRKCKTRSKYLWDLMEEKVDMTNDVERARWVKRKKAILGDVMGGLVGYLEELGDEDGWKEREVREMVQRWEKRWKVYGAMDREELKSAGWILDVGKQTG